MARKPKQKAAKTTSGQLQSPTARLKLGTQARAYFVKIADGAWLGYRKPFSGPGSWVVRSGGSDGKGWERTLWRADDNSLKADGEKVLNFWQAKSKAQAMTGRKPGIDTPMADGAPITLDDATKIHEADLLRRGSNVHNSRRARPHLTEAQLSKPVELITGEELTIWRDGLLKKGLAPSSVNRTISTIRTALTLADKSRAHIWRGALKALPDATEANNVVIEDEAKAQQWVAESYAQDHQLGLLTHVIAESGARPSQAVRLRIRDLITRDQAAPRLMMPKSGKGGTRSPGHRKLERYSVSISPDLAEQLKAAAKGRPSNAPLLVRRNGQAWDEGNPNPYDRYKDPLKVILQSIGLDPAVYGMYAFRHTSITRMLLKGTPTSIVAKAHDTSEAEIRKHFAASILDFSDEITRKTLPSFGPASQRTKGNVVPLKRVITP
ncbi:site-specific integrase [Bradyrhizobium sp. 2]|uniref:tyrosine-type recombinase/integrase n=1 Tax=unclassified Bradyrhizobium TaxID=2631580 RepID=UPI001FFAC50F|nr:MULTISPECIES: site-specific integrase [unclassified Bradyrhizobium]MCK1447762.1 site-specific integrase [Bradyrhizobium sp. 48]MCK1463331.1 site-specific integrase [Bradyrhizobium sp. 2]